MTAERVIVGGKTWNSGSRRLLRWLTLMDAKTTHLGGRHLLTDLTLEVIMQVKSKVSHVEDNDESENESLLAIQSDSPSSYGAGASPDIHPTRKRRRLESLLSDSQHALPLRFTKLNMFNILLQPALEFHVLSTSYSRRIGSQDRHHRSRETVEDEFEVVSICRRFEEELEDLWRQRPAIINLTTDQMMSFVCKDIATKLEQLFCIYIASFWSHFIYIHRVAYWSLKHTELATKAIRETSKMMRRSVGDTGSSVRSGPPMSPTFKNVVHPGLMWPCYLLGCETLDPKEQDWAVSQLRALGELGDRPDTESGPETDGLWASQLDQKGAQNALKASILLRALIEKQTLEKRRVDGKAVAKEVFGYHFYII